MTDYQKSQILLMRRSGGSFTYIADVLGLSRNTVKSYCKRYALAQPIEPAKNLERVCAQCGRELELTRGKNKRFCSTDCSTLWWNRHRSQFKTKGMITVHCENCKRPFFAYPKRKRRFCSHACYIAKRYGHGGN